MQITFNGAARTTTGSMHLVDVGGHRILLDCGLYQGRRAEAFERNSKLPFDAATITHMLLSHAHIDHSGNLPTLVKQGYDGEILCTSATRDLVTLMVRDSAHIQEQDAEYLNQKTSRQGMPPIQPLYTSRDAERALARIVSYAYDQWFKLEGIGRAVFYDAGHILGSAIVVMELQEQGRTVRIGFSGDLGRPNAPILRDPTPVPGLDYLLVESTYGSREHPSFEQSSKELARVISETKERGGKIVIPSFAVGRTQELLHFIHAQIESHQIPALPIFVDSPMAVSATDIFRLHLECFDDETRAHLLEHDALFDFKGLKFVRSVDESRAINKFYGSAIIISANGMAEAGRVLHHLKHNIEDARNTILFVGYQAENTLGRRLIDGVKKVKIFGDEYTVRAKIESLSGFSAHASRSELLSWVNAAKDSLKGVFVVHGELTSALAFADTLRTLGNFSVTVPEPGQTVEL